MGRPSIQEIHPCTTLSTHQYDDSTYRRQNVLNIVLVLPPAPAARVLAGRAFATLSCLSAAARLLRIVLGPPGGVGEVGRAPLPVPEAGRLTGELDRGVD